MACRPRVKLLLIHLLMVSSRFSQEPLFLFSLPIAITLVQFVMTSALGCDLSSLKFILHTTY